MDWMVTLTTTVSVSTSGYGNSFRATRWQFILIYSRTGVDIPAKNFVQKKRKKKKKKETFAIYKKNTSE